MSNVFIDRPLSGQGFVHKFWYVVSTFPAPESCTDPSSTSDQLETLSLYSLVRGGNAYHTAVPEASVGCLESLSHDFDITSSIESELYSPFLILEQEGLSVLLLGRFIADISSELLGDLKFVLIDINSIYLFGSSDLAALDNRQSDGT